MQAAAVQSLPESVALLVNTSQAARLLSISVRKLFDLVKTNQIPVVRIGPRGIRYRVRDLEAFAARQVAPTIVPQAALAGD